MPSIDSSLTFPFIPYFYRTTVIGHSVFNIQFNFLFDNQNFIPTFVVPRKEVYREL
jgi:hypothetical protein